MRLRVTRPLRPDLVALSGAAAGPGWCLGARCAGVLRVGPWEIPALLALTPFPFYFLLWACMESTWGTWELWDE